MKICIDPGHNYSGWNTGASGFGLREQDISFYIGDNLRRLLEDAGVTVIMTRPTLQTNLGTSNASSLSARYNLANRENCDLFVSIHCNSGGGTGTETLIKASGGKAEEVAQAVQTSIVSLLHMTDRGVKIRPELAVLKNTKMPAILVETGFIDTASDAEKLRTRQADFARAIFEGIAKVYEIGSEADEVTRAEFDAYKARTDEIINKMGKEIQELKDSRETVYNYIDSNMPEWAREPVQWMLDKGIILGTGSGLDLTQTKLWVVVVLYRACKWLANLFGKQI